MPVGFIRSFSVEERSRSVVTAIDLSFDQVRDSSIRRGWRFTGPGESKDGPGFGGRVSCTTRRPIDSFR
jgi:hypothetical protein